MRANNSKAKKHKSPNLAKGILKFSKRVAALSTSSTMHSNLVTAVFNFGSDEILKKGKGKKIKVQPNRKRKSGNGTGCCERTSYTNAFIASPAKESKTLSWFGRSCEIKHTK